jgi:hypothetical protein
MGIEFMARRAAGFAENNMHAEVVNGMSVMAVFDAVRRAAEGCLAVEMEAAAFFAVARFRGVSFGQILDAGDDLSGDAWDERGWLGHGEGRRRLLCAGRRSDRDQGRRHEHSDAFHPKLSRSLPDCRRDRWLRRISSHAVGSSVYRVSRQRCNRVDRSDGGSPGARRQRS